MKSGLFAFILLSALVHALVFSIEDDWIFNIHDSHEQGGSSLNVELLAKTESKPSPTIKSASVIEKKLAPITSSIPLQKKISHKVTAANNIALVNTQKTITPPEKTQADQLTKPSIIQKNINQKTNNDVRIKALLNNELSKHFYYPKAAQRKNRQGAVTLAFTITHFGKIKNIHINKSSGFTILDNAAINALKQVNANEDLAKALNGDSTEHTLPVIYKLTQH